MACMHFSHDPMSDKIEHGKKRLLKLEAQHNEQQSLEGMIRNIYSD